MKNRAFKGVWIPARIWLDQNLSIIDKALLTEIESLCTTKDGCFAGNDYFAEFLGVSTKTVSRSIKKLCELGFLSERVEKKPDESGKIKTKRYLTTGQIVRNEGTNCPEIDGQNVPYINTDLINTNINTPKSPKGELAEKFEKIQTIYNKVTQPLLTRSIVLNDKTKRNIKALLKRVKEYEKNGINIGQQTFSVIFEIMARNPFNQGQNDRGWKADIEYCTRPDKFFTVVEDLLEEQRQATARSSQQTTQKEGE